MFAKTFCKPGAFLSVVPVGLRTTLQYNANGLLEKAFVGYEDDEKKVSPQVFSVLKEQKLVPLTIAAKGGTTWVQGVLYTPTEFFDSGVLPMCIEESLIQYLAKRPDDYKFYAGTVSSLAVAFRGVHTIRNWLSMNKFELLPSWVIPVGATEQSLLDLINTPRYPFQFPLISGFMLHHEGEFQYCPFGLEQKVTTKVNKFNDENGYIKARLSTTSDEDVIVQYTDVVRFNIHPASSLVTDASGKLIYSTCTDGKKRDKRSSKLTCSVCGKQFEAPLHGPVCCDDEHCSSKLYADTCRFLRVLNLPELTYEKFSKLINTGKIICLTDVLLLDEYKALQIKTSLDRLIEACVPVTVCADSSIFTMFANRCNNSVQTLEYYINNPQKLVTDLEMSSIFVKRLIEWLSDKYNSTTIQTLIDADNIIIEVSQKKFNGAPIFRDKTILITGKFLHGDMNEIMAILRSYEAEVVTRPSGKVDCVLIGAIKENVDGKAIQFARAENIPMFDEPDFFARYEIDEDLKSNLL